MPATISVPYAIRWDGGIKEGGPHDGPWAEVVFQCKWDDHYQLCQDLMGKWVASGNQIVRTPAFQYPYSPNLFCTDITSIEPYGKPWRPLALWPGWVTRKGARVTARFTIPWYTQDGSDQSGQPYTKLSIAPSGEFLTLPYTTYFFAADGLPTGTPIGRMIPQAEITYTRYKMPIIPVNQMLSLIGKVNNAPFSIGGFLCDTGTLVFMPGSCEVDANTTAMFTYLYQYSLSYIVEYKFLFRSIPHNWFLHPNGTTGFALVQDGNGNPPYLPGDFSILP